MQPHASLGSLLFAALALTLVSAPACDSETQACTPGTTQLCVCVLVNTGVQSCESSGNAYTACQCVGDDTGDGDFTGSVTGDGGSTGDTGSSTGGADTFEGGSTTGDDSDTGGTATGDETDDTGGDDTGANCVPSDNYAAKICFEDSIFWADDCGNKKELVESCDVPQEGCVDGACVIVCAPQSYQDCDNDSAWWFDACGNKDELIETCTGNDICSQGECIEVCAPKAYEGCNGSDVWWFDACDNPESPSETCEPEEFCANATCVKPFYDGTWKIVADPDTKDTGFGSATYNPTTIELSVSGKDVTGLFSAFGEDVEFIGTIEGKEMNIAGQYTDPSTTLHEESWTVEFQSLTEFTGVINDALSLSSFPVGNLVWQITGTKEQ